MKQSAIMLVVLIAFTATAEDAKDKAVMQEREKLKGKWKQISVESKGKDKGSIPGDIFVVIEGDSWIIEAPKRPKSDNSVGKYTFQLDPTKSPKSLDMIFKVKGRDGKELEMLERAIYKLEKDTLTVCFPHAEGERRVDGKERPKEFKVDDGGTICVYERVTK